MFGPVGKHVDLSPPLGCVAPHHAHNVVPSYKFWPTAPRVNKLLNSPDLFLRLTIANLHSYRTNGALLDEQDERGPARLTRLSR